jgi:para-nitrobenzyl esterase
MSLSAPQTVLPVMVTALIKKSVPAQFQPKALELYPPGSNSAEAKKSYINILTDAQFTVNARRTAQCISMNQSEPVWRYFFTHKHTIPQLEIFGSYHGMELFYVFNNWENTLLGSGLLFKPEDEAVQNAMLKYWVNFAETGNPNGEGLENWPQYQSSTDCFLEINSIPNGSQTGLRTAQSDLWDDVAGYKVCTGTVGNEEVSIHKELLIYPNPSNSLIRLDLPVESDFEVAVYNSTGQQIHHSINSNQIDLSGHTDGIYFIEVRTKTTILKGKIIRKE